MSYADTEAHRHINTLFTLCDSWTNCLTKTVCSTSLLFSRTYQTCLIRATERKTVGQTVCQTVACSVQVRGPTYWLANHSLHTVNRVTYYIIMCVVKHGAVGGAAAE